MSREDRSSALQGWGGIDLLLLAVAGMWGTNFSVLKVGLADVPPLFFAAARFVIALALMVPWALSSGHSLRVARQEWLPIAGVGLLGHAAYMVLFLHGAARTSAANAAMILATVPVWVAVIGSASRLERVTRWGWAGACLALAGVFLIVIGGVDGAQLEFGGASAAGDALVLLATLAWSGYSVLVNPILKRCPPVTVTVLSITVGTVPLVLLTLPFVSPAKLLAISTRGWTALIVSAVIGIALPYFIWNFGILRLGSARTSLYSYVTPCFALIVAYLWLGEPLTLLQICGGALVLVGVGLARRPEGASKMLAVGPGSARS